MVKNGPGRIPFVDLGAEHAEVAIEVAQRWAGVLASSQFLAGAEIECFEADFARFCELRHCVTVANGTDALELALRVVGVMVGTEVVVPAVTFIATALAVLRIGARPVLVDVDGSGLMDPRQVSEALSPRTRAVVPVHLYGQMAACEDIVKALGDHDVALVEDAAQAHGARRGGQAVGARAAAVATSFYPTKNLGAYGHGGAVLTDSPRLAAHVRALRSHGSDRKHHHPVMGWNSQLDELQAAVLNAKLPGLAERNQRRRQAAARYDNLLATRADIALPVQVDGNEHVWHLYAVRVPRRDAVLERLHRLGVDAGIHYPVPLHLQPALKHLGYRGGDFPMAEALAASVLSLPLFPTITAAQQEKVVAVLDRCL